MTSSINYKDNLFERFNLTPNCGKSTFKTLHKLRNKIKTNKKAVYSNIGGGVHVHIGIMLVDTQYALISTTPSVYPNHPGPLIIPDSTTAQANSNMQITHINEVHLFLEVT